MVLFVSNNYVINNDITNDNSFIVVYIVISNNIPMFLDSNNYVVDNILSFTPHNGNTYIVVYLVIRYKITITFVFNNYISDNVFTNCPLVQ